MRSPTNRRSFLKGSASLSFAALAPGSRALQAFASVLPTADPGTPSPAAAIGHPLMTPNLAHSLAERCLSKPVFEKHLLDDMETAQGWIASPVVKLGYTKERAKAGTQSMRFSTLMRNEQFIRANQSKNGHFNGDEAAFVGQPFSASAILNFETPQDWSPFNRISLWCYLHPTRITTTSISLQFLCQGASAGPWDPLPIHFIGDLKPGEWNHLTWEISEYPRNEVVQFILFKPTSGLSLSGAESEITFDFDQLQLERVDAEPVSGWAVTPGKISYSHFGYRTAAGKLACCSEPHAETFSVLNAATGAVVSRYPVKRVNNARGSYALLDFTAITTPGSYRLECGASKSEPFPIGNDVFNLLIDVTLNTFKGFRCGCAVPGAHDACHLDTFIEYRGERRSMAGGWHDAANNTQFSDSTQLSIYTLLRLYEQLISDPAQGARAATALDEAKWGLDWSLRMRFAPGIRLHKNFTAYWTDSKVGTIDDVVQQDAGHDLRENIYALVALSTAARVLKSSDAALASQALKAAEEDYADIRPSVSEPIKPITYGDAGRGTWRDLAAYLAVSTVELYRATGKQAYRSDAIRFGNWLASLQEQKFIDGSPLTGFFYADAERNQIQRETYGSCDDSGLLALKALCDAFPDDPDWINWYAGLLIYSEYYCREGSLASAPFQIIPSAIWRRKDLESDLRPDLLGGMLAVHSIPMFPTPPTEEQTRKQMLQMYEAGTPLNPDMRLRVFPIWYNHVQHGSTTAHLCRTAALGCAAQVRGQLDLAELAVRQIQWVVGANPFSRSLIFGVGYDYWQNFTVDNINFVGGLGLGMNSYEADAPAWPNNAVFPYKEQWSYSTSRMAINLAQCAAPARIKGRAASAVVLREQRTGETSRLEPGVFDRALAPGSYSAAANGIEWKVELVGGRTYEFDFDPDHAVTLSLESSCTGEIVTVRAKVRGNGAHAIELKLFNLAGRETKKQVELKAGEDHDLEWQLNVIDTSTPWIVVATPDSAAENRQELFGRGGACTSLS